MNIFISWSGDLSHKVAVVFKEWLPSVIQSVEAYVSSEDIDKGARWSSDISKALEESFFGILCITKDNIDASWINFEAGALSKSFEKSRITPFLLGLNRTELQGPLLQFQSTIFDKDDIKKMISTINRACETTCLEEHRLDKIFEVWWPELDNKLRRLEAEATSAGSEHKDKKVSKENIIEEILLLVRNQQQLLSRPENILPVGYLHSTMKDVVGESLHRDIPLEALDDLFSAYFALNEMFLELKNNKHGNCEECILGFEKAISRLSKPMKYLGRYFLPNQPITRIFNKGLVIRGDK